MARNYKIGRWGEQIAVDTLVAKGYAIVARNWRLHHFEVDIIAMWKDRFVFVEVKTRTDMDTYAALAVDRRKQMRLVAAANTFIVNSGSSRGAQFDIITVNGTPENYTVEHIEDAFYPPLRSYR